MPAHVVTCFLRHGTDVLLTRRSDAVGTYGGRWAGVSGYVESLAGGEPVDALADARREVREEIGRAVDRDDPVRAGEPLSVRDADAGREWIVHPFLFAVDDRAVEPNEELAATEWVQPPAILDRETVPGLWAAYERVAPTVETVRTDREHGSTHVSVRALEVLRDRAAAVAAGVADAGDGDGTDTTDRTSATAPDDAGWAAVAATARALRDARPSMAAVATRVNRVLSDADRTAVAVRDRAIEAVRAALRADEAAAANAADLLGEGDVETVATLSRSETVLATLREAGPGPAVLVGESRPAREGVGVAETLATGGLDVTLTTDAALPALLAGAAGVPGDASARPGDGADTGPAARPDASDAPVPAVDAVLVGADAVLADGSVVNKAGTRALALAAAREGVPVYAVTARDKIRPDATAAGESGDPATVYDGDAAIRVACPTFDRTPADLVTSVVTETGPLDGAGVREVAAEHRAAATWDDATDG